jgi:hypothetical protein
MSRALAKATRSVRYPRYRVVAPTGVGFTPDELVAVRQAIDAEVNTAASKIATAIQAKGDTAIAAIAQQAKDYVAQQAALAGQQGADAAAKSVWKAAIIGGVLGGILGGGGVYLLMRRG